MKAAIVLSMSALAFMAEGAFPDERRPLLIGIDGVDGSGNPSAFRRSLRTSKYESGATSRGPRSSLVIVLRWSERGPHRRTTSL